VSKLKPRPPFRVVGSAPKRADALEKVTGRAQFSDDFYIPRMLHGKTLRSPHAHAIIKSIDVTRALSLPGVHAVITGADFPEPSVKRLRLGEAGYVDVQDMADNCIAKSKVFYDGHVIAAVAAENPHIAEEGVDLIDIEYEILTPVMDVKSAMADGAPVIHEDFTPGAFRAKTEKVLPNAGGLLLETGNITTAFSDCDIIVEREYTTETVHQGYIESHITTVQWDMNGHINIWTSSQGHFQIRDQVAVILNVPMNKITVTPLEIGGGFGGKVSTYLDPLAAMLSKKTGRAVKMAMSRNEALRATGPSSGTWSKVKIGAKSDGRIIAADLECAYEAGAFPGGPIGPGIMTATSRYKIPNLRLKGFDVIVNKPKIMPYRAPGGVQSNFPVESLVDELAEKLGRDPMELRVQNAMQSGDRLIMGLPCPEFDGKALLSKIKSHPHYKAPLEKENQGRGMAYAFYPHIGMQSDAKLTVNADGTVQVCTGSCDLSGTRTSLAMQAAEILGINLQNISCSIGATDAIGYTFMACGSRTTYSTGIAVITAAKKILSEMSGRAALIWDTGSDNIEFNEGEFSCRDNPKKSFTFKELASRLDETGGSLSASATVSPNDIGVQVAGHLVDVEVDIETGKLEILRYTAFQDAGKAVHPELVRGQMQGAAVQGIGWALNEEYFYNEKGQLANATLLDYRMPTSLDVPFIDTVILETPNPSHPFGVRGVGEVSIVPPVAAIANAIYNAVGVRLTSLPMKPGKILAEIKKLKEH